MSRARENILLLYDPETETIPCSTQMARYNPLDVRRVLNALKLTSKVTQGQFVSSDLTLSAHAAETGLLLAMVDVTAAFSACR